MGTGLRKSLRGALVASLLVGGALTTSALVEASAASATAVVVQTINVGCDPESVSSDGTHVWFARDCESVGGGMPSFGGLDELDASNGSFVGDGEVYSTLGGLGPVSSDGTDVWVTGPGGVVEVNAVDGSVVQAIDTASSPSAISSDGTHVWVANINNTVTELNAATGALVQTIGVGSQPFGISSDGTHVWVTNSGDNTVSELSAATGAVVQTIGVGSDPEGISSDGTHVWVTNSGDNTVSELNAATGAVVQTIGVGSDPSSISSDGRYVWVANLGSNTVSDLNASDGSLVQTIGVGIEPLGISSDGTHVWVANANNGSGTMTEIAVPPSTAVVLPSNNATISGTTQYLDATASSGATTVIYEVSGGPFDLSDVQVATGTDTLYGWLAAWNTTTVPDGTYTLQSVASNAGGASGTSPGITVTVDNPAPSTSVVLPSNGATLSGTIQYLDATTSSGVTKVIYEVSGGPSDLSDVQVATGTRTLYGWLAAWNTTTVPNGTYTLQSVATSSGVPNGTSAGISVTVDNPAPATTVVLPADSATISGTTQYLDATASSGVTKVIYQVSGGPSDLSDVQVATGTDTLYGWLAAWNTTTVPDGTYTLESVASYAGGVSGTSAGITVMINN
jgi:YVTN family beta-propeller protein